MIKNITWILLVLLTCFNIRGYAQVINWGSLENSDHIISAGFEWDYSVSYSLGYAYRINTETPILLRGKFSVPSGENVVDDFKTMVGAEVVVLDHSRIKASISAQAVYRRYENPLVRMMNFGSYFNCAIGYYHSSWFIAGEISFDNAIVSNLKHSESFRQTIFSDVKDGWYQPTNAGNFLYGVQVGYSLGKSDLTLNLNLVTTQDYSTTPLIPYYLRLGYNYRFD